MGKEIINDNRSIVVARAAKQSLAWQVFVVTLVVTCFFRMGYCQPSSVGYVVPWMQVTALPGNESNPALSPDGRWLAFVSDQEGNRDIWAMPASGGVAKQLTAHPSADYSPNWSPDWQSGASPPLKKGEPASAVSNAPGYGGQSF